VTRVDHDSRADVDAVIGLKHAYLRCLDLRLWDEFEQLFVPEATGAYAGLDFSSREELVGYMSTTLTPDMITFHQAHHPEVTVEGDQATAVWYLHDKVFVPAYDVVIEGAAFYRDRCVRTPHGWRFTHVGYERTYEASWTMSSVAGWSFKVGRAYDAWQQGES
jgi:hypothetical protein